MRSNTMMRTKIGVVLASTVLGLACGGYEEELPGELEGEQSVDEGKEDSASVKVTTDGKSFQPSDSIPVAVANGHKHSIYLTGCNQTALQRRDGTSWKDVGPDKACFWEGLAVQVKGGTTFKELLLPRPEGTYRVKVVYKTSCAVKTPFSGCKGSTRTSYSAQFTVKKDECWGAWLDQNGNCRTPSDGVYPAKCCEGQMCGGIAGIKCPAGQRCVLDGNYPDASGKCVACPPVLCELYCANGFDVDKNGCEICKCKPAQNDCRQAGCAAGKYCTFCWTAFMCIPNGAMC
jgi:hypothetical protein